MELERRYEESLNWIHNLGRFGIRLGLERVYALLEALGRPQDRLKFVHVGGTNGKGSTAAMLAAILRSAGYKTGLYTSPYLLSFTNRMALNGSDISRESLVKLVERVKPLALEISGNEELGPLSEFEVVTALALTFFAEESVDLVVLEVGLGGRLDATNVIDPLLSLITNVSLEHTAELGDTVEKIAYEKAGIIKKQRPLITAAEDPAVLKVIKKRCQELKAPLIRVYPPFETEGADKASLQLKPRADLDQITDHGQYFTYTGLNISIEKLFIPLHGLFQLHNAASALAAVELLGKEGFQFSVEQIKIGLSAAVWPGRLELLSTKPKLLMDGAHNPAAMEKLAAALPAYFKYEKLILVLGILADKDIYAILKHILPLAAIVIYTKPMLPRAADPEEIYSYVLSHFKLNQESMVLPDCAEALQKALALAGSADLVLVTGSLYTVSDARAWYMNQKG